MLFYLQMSTNITQQRNNQTFKIQLYFDSHKSSADLQWNEKCKNYTQLDQLKKIKRAKSRPKREIKDFVDGFWFLETGHGIVFTLLIHNENIWFGKVM